MRCRDLASKRIIEGTAPSQDRPKWTTNLKKVSTAVPGKSY